MRYRTRHVTHYHYEAPVSQCQSELRLTPRSLPWQTVLGAAIETTPAYASIDTRTDYFGNTVKLVSILESHDDFSIVASCDVEVDARPAAPPSEMPWDVARDEVVSGRSPGALEAVEFVFDSPFVACAPDLAAYAAASFAAGRPLVSAVQDLSHRIHSDFTYKPTSTAIDTPLLEVLRRRHGVCQDFAHVMIGALRSMGLPGRYVSGYLRSGADYQGAEASHAWVSIFLPGTGWIDFDPTNDVVPGTGHVTLAWGRDYGDVTPIKGIAIGGGAQRVDVEVRVDPV
jgi:transglutaminase-like putative cysteine protease